MELKDFIITPIVIIGILFLAFVIRPYLTTPTTRKYFIPALLVRFFGAIALGLIYQFYYGFGGDTMNYFNQGSIIYHAFHEDALIGIKLLLSNGQISSDTYSYSSLIPWYRSAPEFMVIKFVGFFSIVTLNTYTSVAVLFALFSFTGSWLMFKVFQEEFPEATKNIAIAILFIPSVIFWGSGILKDTITLGALGIFFWGINKLMMKSQFSIWTGILVVIAFYMMYVIKIYILICFIPAVFIWWYSEKANRIKEGILKILIAPLMIGIVSILGFYLLELVASTSNRYNLDSLAEWAYITSHDIRYYTGRDAGSGYDLGFQDGTWQNLITLAPSAINVSIFRPYIWEVRNPLMLLSALEATLMMIVFMILILRFRSFKILKKLKSPLIRVSLIFAIAFAFAVGVSTYNFGSLSRYKIPMMPFFSVVLAIGLSKQSSFRKPPHRSLIQHLDQNVP